MTARFRTMSVDSVGGDFHAAKTEGVTRLLGTPARAPAGKATYYASPRPDQNVIGVGIGRRFSGGKGQPEHAIRIYVARKLPKSFVGKHRLPDHFGGVRTDVIETGRFRALATGVKAARARTRPLRPGLSIGFASGDDFIVGTIAAIVQRGADQFVLSNNHVLAFENLVAAGTDVVQPGIPDDGRTPQDRIGALAEFIPLTPMGNQVDAAIAKIDNGVNTVGTFSSGLKLASGVPLAASTELRIVKVGRSTGVTKGRIDDLSMDVAVDFATGQFVFDDQILLRAESDPFSGDGDSGSLIVAQTERRPVALLFAGAAKHALATPIDRVLAAFGVTIVA